MAASSVSGLGLRHVRGAARAGCHDHLRDSDECGSDASERQSLLFMWHSAIKYRDAEWLARWANRSGDANPNTRHSRSVGSSQLIFPPLRETKNCNAIALRCRFGAWRLAFNSFPASATGCAQQPKEAAAWCPTSTGHGYLTRWQQVSGALISFR